MSDEDYCYECEGYGDNDDCDNCPFNPLLNDDE